MKISIYQTLIAFYLCSVYVAIFGSSSFNFWISIYDIVFNDQIFARVALISSIYSTNDCKLFIYHRVYVSSNLQKTICFHQGLITRLLIVEHLNFVFWNYLRNSNEIWIVKYFSNNCLCFFKQLLILINFYRSNRSIVFKIVL